MSNSWWRNRSHAAFCTVKMHLEKQVSGAPFVVTGFGFVLFFVAVVVVV